MHVVGGNGRDRIDGEIVEGNARYAVQLELESEKTPVVHMAGGNVNYYSRERMETEGTLTIGTESLRVHGDTWFDHQFGDQQIGLATVRNWTWIGAQLDDDREVYLLALDRQDGTQLLTASVTDDDCTTTEYSANQISITSRGTWTPPANNCQYPMGWNVSIPAAHLEYQVDPAFENQDIVVPGSDHYWEGDSRVVGGARGRAYVELFGYCPFLKVRDTYEPPSV